MRRRAALGAAALSLLALAAVRAGGGGGPPLYDGICPPVAYLSLGANPGPTSASQTFTAADLGSSHVVATAESTPQAQLIFAGGSLAPAPGQSTVTVTITPVKPPAVKPSGGTIDGNVYDFEARSGGQPVALTPGHPATIVLAATSSGGPKITLEHFDGSRWVPAAQTFASGCGTTYEAAEPTLGQFALVASGSSVPGGSGGGAGNGGSGLVIPIVIAAVLVALALLIGSVRLRRTRPRRVRRR